MKERPILFSGEMVRAILDGRKTQTRRVCKTTGDGKLILNRQKTYVTCCELKDGVGPFWHPWGGHPGEPMSGPELSIHCPYGKPGERLWVRESFQPILKSGIDEGDCDYKTGRNFACHYPATDPIIEFFDTNKDKISSAVTPSIHMPRWASRITLEITNVRVERLNDISEEDAKAEGAKYTYIWEDDDHGINDEENGYFPPKSHYSGFEILWKSINGEGSWDKNPWVWVIEFKRIS